MGRGSNPLDGLKSFLFLLNNYYIMIFTSKKKNSTLKLL